jgi:hypothetical protein
MPEYVPLWAAFALLLVLCLPFAAARKVVLEISSWGLRLALLALLAGGAFLWFRPASVPAEVVRVVDASPLLRDILPTPGSQSFGLAAATLIVAILLPLLAVLDVARILGGGRLRRLCRLSDATRVEPVLTSALVPAPPPAPDAEPASPPSRPILTTLPTNRRPDRRAAAETMAEAGSRNPFRVADHVSRSPGQS